MTDQSRLDLSPLSGRRLRCRLAALASLPVLPIYLAARLKLRRRRCCSGPAPAVSACVALLAALAIVLAAVGLGHVAQAAAAFSMPDGGWPPLSPSSKVPVHQPQKLTRLEKTLGPHAPQHPQLQQPQQTQRRNVLSHGLTAIMGSFLGSGATFSPLTHAEDDPCSCCEKDWCGCGLECIDCHSYLKSRGYQVPLSLADAKAKAGTSRWPSALGWRSASMPRWRPAKDVELRAGASALEGAGQGLFATAALPKGTVMPPYQGPMLSYGQGQKGGNYVYCPYTSREALRDIEDKLPGAPALGDLSFCVDAKPAVEDNPSRLINAAATAAQCKEVNVEICEIGQVMYYRTTRPVPVGDELVTDYGSTYWGGLDSCQLVTDNDLMGKLNKLMKN